MSRKVQKWTVESVQAWCKEQGIEFLSDTYLRGKDKYQFQCACGNTFVRTFKEVLRGSINCLNCINKTSWDLEKVQVWCKEQGIEFLNDAYYNSTHKYHFQCACDNTFERPFKAVLTGQTRCLTCSAKWTVEKVQEWCKDKNMKFLDDTYGGVFEKHNFQCACGNTFECKFTNVLKGQTRCSVCSNKTSWDLEKVKIWCNEQGIEFLSDIYTTSPTKYHFKCACGNTFERRFSDVTQGLTNCLTCSGITKWDIETVKEKCTELGIEFLDDIYQRLTDKYHFKCACGETFERTFSGILKGHTNCLACSNKTLWDIESIKAWCNEQGIEFLSDTYHGVSEKYLFQCACGNTYERIFSNVYQGQINCLPCNNITPWDTEYVKAWCKEQGIEFLEDIYRNSKEKYLFQCACGDTFERTFRSVIQGNTSCLSCTAKWTVEKVQEWCANEGIKFLSDTYLTRNSKYLFQCACGNEFERQFSVVIQGHTNCLSCSPKWTLEKVQDWCINEGIVFLEDTFTTANTKYNFQCACGNTFERPFKAVLTGQTNCLACSNRTLWDVESVKVWCKEQGMEFLDDYYINSEEKYHFRCVCGNTFERRFDGVTQGQVRCSECANKTLWDTEKVQEWCKEQGIEFLDEVYYKNSFKHNFRCACGNTFERRFNSVTQGLIQCLDCGSKSKGEAKILDFLLSFHIPYEREYIFSDLRGVNDTSPLRFDFAITINDQLLLVEYDGKQHFEPIEYFGGEEAFQQLKNGDQKKNEYCEKHNIPLLRIPYYEFDNIEKLLTDFIKKY